MSSGSGAGSPTRSQTLSSRSRSSSSSLLTNSSRIEARFVGRASRLYRNAGGGRFLTLWTPGGPEAMFIELSRLGSDGLRDPDVRRMLSARFDSIPV